MIYRLKITLITLSLLCFATLTKAQISATFTATQTNICEGIAVGFIPTINSTNPIVSVYWDFGDGVFVNDPLPYGIGMVYNTAGTYTIRLAVNDNAGNTDTTTVVDMVTVNPNPEVSFTVLPTAGCQPLDVQFSPIISSPSTNGWTWTWVFSSDSICFAGDNRDTIIRTNPNPFTNTFQNDGIYDIKLVVENQFSCQSDTAAFNVFTVEPKPTASFTAQVQVDCDETTTVNFTSNSTLTCTGTPTYIWDFGDGSTVQNTTQPTIAHEYQTSGLFTVQLITTDGTPNGCSDTTTQTISIPTDPTVTIQAPNDGCTTDFLQFNGSSSGTVSSWAWDFGDGNSSTLQNPTHAYAIAGCYTPSLTITVDTCSFTTQLDTCIVISSTPTAAFTSLDDFQSCAVPHTMAFTSSVTGTATPMYSWNFGDETTSTNANPTKTWNYAGTYPISLTVSTPQGCTSATLNDTVVIDSIVVNFTSDIVSGCEPIVVQFSDNSTAYTGVTGWLWRFGDGSTSTQQNPTYTYSSAGFYDVELVITTAQGCSDSLTISNYITVGTAPTLSFVVSDNTPCLGDSISFINNSSNGTNWLWFNGIDTVSGFNIPDVSYSASGVYNAWLSAENNGCVDTLFQYEIVSISNFEVNFGENGNCAVSPTAVDFFDNSTGSISSWHYDFGVAGISNDTSNLQNPSYNYPAVGQYTATLTVTNTDGCSLTDSITVDLSLPVANFGWTTDSVACVSVDFAVAIVDSSDNNQGGCSWIMPDEATFLFGTNDSDCEPIISFDSAGYYNLTQIVASTQGCFDTIVNEICVTDVTAVGGVDTLNGSGELIDSPINFTDNGNPIVGGSEGCIIQINPTTGDTIYITAIGTTPINCSDPNLSIYTGCVPLTVEFTDSSFGFPDTIVSYSWDFGDGNTSNLQNPTHIYDVSSGEFAYLVTLTVVNQYGVINTDTLSTFIRPTEPIANFSISADTVCTNLPITTVDSSSGFGLSYNWDFGDGSNSTVASPSFSYNVEGNYQVCLTVTDINGCDSTVCDSILVIDPVANFSADTTYSECDNLTVAFSDSSDNAISWFWSFGNGNMSIAQNPSTIYSGTGFYDLMLIVGGAGGCQDTLTQPSFIQVDGPDLLELSVSPTDSCEDHQVAFNIQGTNIGIVTIEFGDGNDTTFSTFTSLALDTTIYYTYDTAGVYNPVLKIEDSLNCERVFNFNTITTTDPLASFALDTTLGCVPLTITANANASEFANQYQWIAPGATISGQGTASPSFTFQNEGYYNEVTLVVTDVNNCTDTLSFTDTITVADVYVGFYPDNYTGCYPLTVEFTDTSSAFADTIVSWYWEFVNGDTDTLQNPTYVYDGAVNVNQRAKLTVTSSYGCVSSVSKAILPTFPTAAFVADTFVCTGQNISFINQSTGLGLSYLWNSDDGATTTVTNPTYSYAVEDTFQVTLTVTDVNGCVDVDTLEQLIVANPVASFTSDKTFIACPPDSVQFIDASLNAVAWSWTIQGTNPTNYNIQNPAVAYTTPGVYDVELIITSASGCQDTMQIDSMITVDGPYGTVDFATTAGCVDLSVDYEILLSNTTNVILDNGESIEVFVNPGDTLLYNYIYTERGTYSPTVFIQDALGCQRILTNGSITVTDPEPIFTISPDTSCIPMMMMTTTNSSLDVDDFEWISPTLTIDNSNSFTPNFSTNNAGYHDVSLVITDVYGCEDTLTQTILASNVTAYASSNVTAGCLPLTVQFSDLSAYIPEGAISSWVWNFGDGSGVSTEQNPTYVYTTRGNFTPTVMVTNLYGCTSSFTLPSINVSYPNASFVPSLTYACTGQDILFDNQSSGQNVTYLWDFDNGQTSTQEDPTYAFANEGTYNVCVTVTDDNGCDSTYCHTITIANPVAAFTSNTQYLSCPQNTIQFSDASANAVSWFWTFGDGNSSTTQSPTHTYTATGFYDVQLIVTSASGCQDTSYQEAYIEVGGPVGNFTFVPNQGCADVTATFTGNVTQNSVSSYIWNYGNGIIDTVFSTASTDNISHTYISTGTFFPTLTLEDSTGCQFNISLDSIEVDTLQFDFTVDTTLACEAGTFTFTPTIASSSPIDSVVWNFAGADVTVSNAMMPTITYSTVGDYDVTLTVYSRHCTKTVTKSTLIKIAPDPVTNFVLTPNEGCNPVMVNFTDATSIFSGSVVSWNWNLGNGTIDTTQNPVMMYTAVGQYDVELTTVSDFGCTNTLLLTDTVTVYPIPNPTFDLDTFACTGQGVFFTNTSTGNNLTYNWTFGDGDTSTLFEPIHQYTSEGTFTVCLTVTSSDGCDSTLCKTVTIADPVAAFTSNTQYLSCPQNTIQFSDASANAVSWFWTFGDGNSSTTQSPTHTYTATGFYDVQLIVTSASGCQDTSYQEAYIEVGGPVGNFTFVPNQGCADVTATFTGNVTQNSVSSYIWNYGNGIIDTVFSTASTDNISYTYTSTGTFFPTLTLEDSTGCQFNISLDSIEVDTLQFDFTVDTTLACEAGTFTFTPTISSSSPIDSVVWNFAGADVTVSNAMMPTITYSTVGDYDVTLTVYSRHCTKTVTKPTLIKIAPDPVTNFVLTPNEGCNPLTVNFTDATSIFSGSVVSWNWNLGNGTTDTTQNPVMMYTTVGQYNVELTTVSDFGCTNTLLLTDTVTVYPIPNPTFDLDTFACTGQDVFFTNTSTGNNLTYNWTFGDGDTSTLFEPIHQYTSEGTFTVCLTVTSSDGCDSTLCKTVTIANPVAAFTSNTQYLSCPQNTIQFTDASANTVSWFWTFGDGNSSTTQSPTHTYTATGFYDVQLIVTSASGCQDTSYQEAYIEVGGPVGNFTFAPNQGCADVTATFVGTLTANSVTQYHWNFGNGDSTTHTTTAAIDSFDYVYTVAGTYFPTLTLEDSTGCQFNISLDSIEVDTLQFDFVASDTLICETDTIVFTPTIYSSSPIDSVIWIFDGAIVSTSMDSIPAIPYDTVGDFDVSLTVFSNHCFKTITKTQYIKAAPIPESYFTSVTNPFCSEQTIGFNDASTIFSGSVVGWNWDFGDTNTSTLTNPTHVYADSGFYTVNLQVISDFGCADDTTMTIYINKTPEPTMTVAPTLCIGEVLTLTPSGGATYEWYEGVNLICDTCVSIDIAPAVTTDYTLVAISSAGCRDTITQTVNVLPFSVPPLVVSNDTTICKGDIIQLFASGGYDVTQYQWDQSSAGLSCYTHCTNPFASPEVTTTFYVTLTWDGGCSKTDSITVTVIDDAQPILGADRTICQGESVELGVAVGTNAVWSPNAGLSCVSCDNPVASPMQTTTYAVEVTTANGCTIHDTITINVQTPDMIDAGEDATICDGTTIQLNGVAVGNFAWISSSSLSDTTILNPIASPLVTTDYILTVQNDLCIQQDTVRIVVADKVDITVEDIEICEGETAEIDIIGYAETITLLPDSGIINADPLLVRPTETATYMVVGTVPSCEADTAIFTITVNPIPDIGLLPQMTVFNGTTTPLPIDNPNTQYMYTWTPSDLLSCPDCYNPSFTSGSIFDEMMIYVDILTDEGCAFSDSILVILSESCGNNLVQLPTAFTPNDDGNNDIFRVRAVGVTDIEIFCVYNRWGEQLFETTQLGQGWDGTYKGEPVEQGVYMYYVQVICPLTGEVLTVKGDVFLHF